MKSSDLNSEFTLTTMTQNQGILVQTFQLMRMILIFQYLLDGILEWIERVDEFFEYRNFPETMQAKLVESKFKDRALI